MVSWQAFPSFPSSSRASRVSLAPKTPFPFPFKLLPRGLENLVTYASENFGSHVTVRPPVRPTDRPTVRPPPQAYQRKSLNQQAGMATWVNKDVNGKRKLFLYPCCLKGKNHLPSTPWDSQQTAFLIVRQNVSLWADAKFPADTNFKAIHTVGLSVVLRLDSCSLEEVYSSSLFDTLRSSSVLKLQKVVI